MNTNKEYIFLESSLSICSTCQKKVEAKIVQRNTGIFIIKNCLEHGIEENILEEDASYFFKKRRFDKPGSICKTQTKIQRWCPFDCGICPDHEQHTCIGLIEITDSCNLKCNTCYANSGVGEFLSLETIGKMMDTFMDTEFGKAEILQISGWEPTLHPKIFEIIALAKTKKIRYVMLNTNGLRIAEDEEFVQKLSEHVGWFEVYLQFDGFKPSTHTYFRGRNLSETKQRAIANLQKYGIPVTLVCTLERWINDDEIGEIIAFWMQTEYVRGINFQPVTYFGRCAENPKIQNRITLSGVIQEIEKQSLTMTKNDFVPLPCDVDRIAVGYFVKKEGRWNSLAREVDLSKHLENINNSFAFKLEEVMSPKNQLLSKVATALNCCDTNLYDEVSRLIGKEILDGTLEEKRKFLNNDIFRISITSFIDVHNFDIKSVKKDCVHILTKDGRKIPFSTYNMFYRTHP